MDPGGPPPQGHRAASQSPVRNRAILSSRGLRTDAGSYRVRRSGQAGSGLTPAGRAEHLIDPP